MKINMERRLSFKYKILTIAFLSTLIVTCSQNINEEFADDKEKSWCTSKYYYLINQTKPYERYEGTNPSVQALDIIVKGGGWKSGRTEEEREETDRILLNLKTAKSIYYESIEAIWTDGDNPQNDTKSIISGDTTINWPEVYADIYFRGDPLTNTHYSGNYYGIPGWLYSRNDFINWVLFGEDIIKGLDEDFNDEFKRIYGYGFGFYDENVGDQVYSNRNIFNTELLLLRTDNEGALKLCKVWEELSY